MILLECFPVLPQVWTIEILACPNSFHAAYSEFAQWFNPMVPHLAALWLPRFIIEPNRNPLLPVYGSGHRIMLTSWLIDQNINVKRGQCNGCDKEDHRQGKTVPPKDTPKAEREAEVGRELISLRGDSTDAHCYPETGSACSAVNPSSTRVRSSEKLKGLRR